MSRSTRSLWDREEPRRSRRPSGAKPKAKTSKNSSRGRLKRPTSAPARRPARVPRQTEEIETPEQRLTSLAQKAQQCEGHGLMAELITLRIECLALARLCYGKLDRTVIEAQHALAKAYLLSGLDKQAVEHASQALHRAREHPFNDLVMSASHTLGRAFSRLQEYGKAHDALTTALKLASKGGQDTLAACPILASLAQMHAAQGETQHVIKFYERVASLKEPKMGRDVELIDTYLELARAFFDADDDEACQQNLGSILEIVLEQQEAVVIVDDPRLAINKKKKTNRDEHEYGDEGSEGDEGDSDVIDDDQVDLKVSWKVADARCLLAASLKRGGGDFDQALHHYEAARQMYEVLGVLQPKVKGSQGARAAATKAVKIERELATIHVVLENYNKAAKHLLVVLRAQEREAAGGRFDASVALTYQRLGDVYTLARSPREAQRCFEEAIHLYRTLYGEKHKSVQTTLARLKSLKLDASDAAVDDGSDFDDDDYGHRQD